MLSAILCSEQHVFLGAYHNSFLPRIIELHAIKVEAVRRTDGLHLLLYVVGKLVGKVQLDGECAFRKHNQGGIAPPFLANRKASL